MANWSDRADTLRDLELCRESRHLIVGRMRGLPDGSYKDKLRWQKDALELWIARYLRGLAE